jgi:hypothetical protein
MVDNEREYFDVNYEEVLEKDTIIIKEPESRTFEDGQAVTVVVQKRVRKDPPYVRVIDNELDDDNLQLFFEAYDNLVQYDVTPLKHIQTLLGGLSVRGLAKLFGWSSTTIQSIFTGKTPSLRYRERIAALSNDELALYTLAHEKISADLFDRLDKQKIEKSALYRRLSPGKTRPIEEFSTLIQETFDLDYIVSAENLQSYTPTVIPMKKEVSRFDSTIKAIGAAI